MYQVKSQKKDAVKNRVSCVHRALQEIPSVPSWRCTFSSAYRLRVDEEAVLLELQRIFSALAVSRPLRDLEVKGDVVFHLDHVHCKKGVPRSEYGKPYNHRSIVDVVGGGVV